MTAINKLGIIAGSGALPEHVIQSCQEKGQECHVIAFKDITDSALVEQVPHDWITLGDIGKAIKLLRGADVDTLVLVGRVGRPALSSLNLDFSGVKLLSKLSKLSSQGDDAVFSTIIKFLEDAKFQVVGVDEILSELLIPKGTLGSVEPDDIAQHDIELGAKTARDIGQLDIGQAVIIQRGQILGVEGAEGTDKLVERCKELHTEGPGGVLVKMKKPEQDTRVDLPTIGVHTVENAANSGLRGIAVEAGGSLILNRNAVIETADRLGVFVVGI